MRSLNKVLLLGNLGQDCEYKRTQSDFGIINFSLATTDTWIKKEGGTEDRTEWHKVVVFGKMADALNKYLKKGKRIFLEGKIQTRTWDDQSGAKRKTTEIIAQNIILLDGGENRAQVHQVEDRYQGAYSGVSDMEPERRSGGGFPEKNYKQNTDKTISEAENFPRIESNGGSFPDEMFSGEISMEDPPF